MPPSLRLCKLTHKTFPGQGSAQESAEAKGLRLLSGLLEEGEMEAFWGGRRLSWGWRLVFFIFFQSYMNFNALLFAPSEKFIIFPISLGALAPSPS